MSDEMPVGCVLVVDDDTGLRDLIVRTLGRAGFSATGVPDGASAIAAAIADPDSVLVLDQRLPDMTGRDVITRLAEQGRQRPFIVMTGQGDERLAVEMMKLGAADYLVKDTDLVTLLPSVMHRVFRSLGTERELREAQEELRQSRALLARSQEIAHVGSWMLDVATGRLAWSDETYRICGLEPRALDVTFDRFIDLVHPEDRETVARAYGESRAADTDTYEVVHRIVRPNGDVRTVHERCVHERDVAGHIVRSAGMVQDITDRRRAEDESERLQAQLLQAQKMESVGRLAGGVAHDFNNMLGVILGHTEMALEQVGPNEALRADLTEIRLAAERSANLTRQLLAFARRQTVAPRVLDLNDTVEGMLKMLRRLIGEDISLTWKPSDTPSLVKMDPSQIDQILANLCVNARDAIAGVGQVTIETGAEHVDEGAQAARPWAVPGDFVRIRVHDSGRGMDADTMARIFEPFFTTKELGKGSGLGLATVYGIVKQNEGFIDVSSVPGTGSCFTVYLPRHTGDHDRESDAAHLARIARPGRETILLVEDEPAVLTLTARMLESQGYEVLPASSPAEGLRLAEAHTGRVDLLMTDVIMPEMNGRDLADRVRARHPATTCLFMSGYTADVIADHGVLEPGVHFIQKPFSLRELGLKVQDVMASRGTPSRQAGSSAGG